MSVSEGISCSRAIGLFDSGVGGLSVTKHLKALLPDERFIYLGDTARVPYGTKGASVIKQYAVECANFLEQRNVKLVVIACNSASSVASQALRESCSCPVVDVIKPAAEMALSVSRSGRIGVIGTNATINSQAYVNALESSNSEVQVFSRACPLFVPLVEEGMLSGPIVDMVVARYLTGLRGSGIDSLILGCTHYPLLKPVIQSYLGPQVRIIDCGEAAALEVKNIMFKQGLCEVEYTADMFGDDYFVTDAPEQFERMAIPFLENEGVRAVKVHCL